MFTVRYCPTVDSQIVRRRIIFNPNYGGDPTEVPGTCTVRCINKGVKPQTRAAITKSVKAEGFRNPILVYATVSGVHLSFGGGRLLAAQQLDVPIPAIVVDYSGDFQLFEEVTPDNWRGFFRDVPEFFEFSDAGVHTHYGLERGRNEWFDPAGIEWAKELDDNEFLIKESPWLSDSE